MTDHEVTALVIDCAQLVANQDTTAALSLLGSSDIDHRHLVGVIAGELRGVARADDGDDTETGTEAI